MSRPALALYQPDIPGNTGAILRLGACLDLDVHLIKPAGFDLSDKALRRAGMDYLAIAALIEHVSYATFDTWRRATGRRLVLATTRASTSCHDFAMAADDIILFGRETAGVPDQIHDQADARITIPMRQGARSLNLALSAAMISSEIIRRFGIPPDPSPQGQT
ncbi:tRNA (cytidine(34)-2'-O)-methyltransferase [Pseudohoeflea coraliihabitans]|uniref:tRNA (cytidine(34)-2'-O)-methyltransferase n=1 Tax=Pseudohoeflea coraliihabitans TaxID=2860393 RepID=A0ABS6WM19_9HYPH|nr:tRNA (cytidine(34)-2'-O)-methyltransferase [Pseudohoeflea sp. DP4N28-3]MBW3096119.1 tRNA (cytidine(34)-2'-O)-methyltransferase [Pseudohoeflea sp. DP4N28-3]